MKQNVWVGAGALRLTAAALVLMSPLGRMAMAQQPTIPDAPKPQLPALDKTVPGSGSSPSSSATSDTPTATSDSFQPPVGSTLPQTLPATDSVQTEAPVVPLPGEGPATFIQRLRVNFVEVPFTVKDSKGHLVPGITPREVRIYENGLRQRMQVFTVDPFPLSVALVIDQSLPYDVMTKVNNALGSLGGAFTAYDEVAVYTYNNGPKLQTDFTAGQSPRLSAVIERSKTSGRDPMYYDTGEALSQNINLNNGADIHTNPLVNPQHGQGGVSGTANVPKDFHTLNDAIMAAAQGVSKAGKGRRRIIYVISDGKEYGSTAKTKDVIKYLQTNKIAVYGTLVGDSAVEGMGFVEKIHLPMMMRDNLLSTYTKATGGETYAEFRTKGIETSFSKITEEVRTQYTVGYNTSVPFSADSTKMRKIEVRVLRPNLEVIAKEGYYPSATDFQPTKVPQISDVKPQQ